LPVALRADFICRLVKLCAELEHSGGYFCAFGDARPTIVPARFDSFDRDYYLDGGGDA